MVIYTKSSLLLCNQVTHGYQGRIGTSFSSKIISLDTKCFAFMLTTQRWIISNTVFYYGIWPGKLKLFKMQNMDLKIELFEITFTLYLPGKRSGYTTQHHHQVWLQHLTLIRVQVIFSSSDFYVEKKANCNTKAIDASDTAQTTWIYYFTEMLLLPFPSTQHKNQTGTRTWDLGSTSTGIESFLAFST